jgi:predicted ATPase/class 3 adenylate cyclase
MTDLPSGTVTLLFTDIEGSTRLLQDLGDVYGGLLEAHGRILRAAISAGEGVEMGTEGDSFFAVFATPGGALRAAVQAQRALAEEAWPRGRQVRVRMGLHTGAVQLRGRDYVGLDVHRAARIGAAGHGGQVLLSDATRALVEPDLPAGVGLRDLGRHHLKDLELPEHLYDLAIAGLPSEFPPPRTLEVPRTNLPAPRTSFVGRQEAVAEVIGLLASQRLVTLTGPGGTGKTRLALQVAGSVLERFPEGVYFVDLSALRDPDNVASSIAATLGVREEPGRDLLDALLAHLGDRRILLVLDNFEQVVTAAVGVGRMLDGTAQLAVLATSRVPLHLSGEREYPVPPLALPDAQAQIDLPALAVNEAVSLFVERATAVQPGFGLTAENAGTVAQLATRLDGLPLAIELAASRVKMLTPEALLDRLSQRLPILTGGPRDVPERQRTLRAAIDWSWELLDPDQQRLLARLGVFSGGWTLASAEEVCQPGLALPVLDGLASLIDQSLVRDDPAAESGLRFRLLEVIGEYAADQLAASGEEGDLRRRHVEHFMMVAEQAEAALMGADRIAWLARLDGELANLRSALEWAHRNATAAGQRIATAMWRYWLQRGQLDEGRRWLERFVSTTAEGPHDASRIRALGALGGVAYWQHEYPAMGAAYEEALRLAREIGDPTLVGRALFDAAYIPAIAGDFERGSVMLREGLSIAEQTGDRGLGAEIAATLAFSELATAGSESALARLSAAIAVHRELGRHAIVTDALLGLGAMERHAGDIDQAAVHVGEALTMAREARDPGHAMGAMLLLSQLATDQANHERAARLLGAAARLSDQGGAMPPPELISRVRGSDPEAPVREALGEQAYAAARGEGYAMTFDDAVAFALQGAARHAKESASV